MIHLCFIILEYFMENLQHFVVVYKGFMQRLVLLQ